MEAGKIMQKAVVLAVVYWITTAIRSAMLVEEMGFFEALYSGGVGDWIVRLIIVLLILGTGWKLKQALAEAETMAEQAETDVRNGETALNALGAGTIILDHRGIIRQVNESARGLLGKAASELQGQKFVDVFAAPGSQETLQQLIDASRSGRGSTVGIQLVGRDDSRIDVSTGAAPYQTHAMDEAGTLLVLADTSSLHRSLRQTQQTLERWQAAMADASVPVALVNEDLELEWASPAMAMGDSSMSWIEKNFTVDQRIDVEETLRAAFADEKIAEWSFELKGKPFLGLLVPFLDGHDKPKVLWISTDTASIQKELVAKDGKLQQLEDDLVERSQEINELEEQINQLNRERADMEGEKDRLSAALEQTESEVRVQQQREDSMEQELSTARNRIAELENTGSQLEETKHLLEQEKGNLEDRLRDLETRQQELVEKLQSWRNLPASADVPWLLVDASGQLRQGSPGLEEIIGRSGDELASEGIESLLIDEGERQQHLSDLESVLRGQRAPIRMVQLQTEKGIISAVTSLQLHQESGEQPMVWVTVLPVDQLRGERDQWKARAQAHQVELDNLLEEMEIERDRFHGVIQGVDQGVILTDVYHRVVLMNRAAEDVLGIRLSEVLDRPVRFAVRDPKFTNELERTLSEKRKHHAFVLDPEQTGLEQPLDLSASIVENKSGKPICVVTRIALR